MAERERPFTFDQDKLLAAVELVGRSGGTEYEVGFQDEDALDSRDAKWWATALYRGAKVMVENYPGPDHASEALARRILTMNGGATCTHCTRKIVLGASKRAAHRARRCVWTRKGATWTRGCADRIPDGRRAIQRRGPL